MYILGRGDVFIGERNAAGAILAGKRFHCPSFELEVSADYAEHKNSSGRMRVRDARIATEQMVKLAMSLDTKDPIILAMALGGVVTADAGTTFTNVAFPSGLAVGDVIPIPGGYNNLSTLVITDSAGAPATLSLNTHYTVDLANGLITIVNLAAYVQPLKASGQTAVGSIVSIATETTVEKFIRFNGIDIADDDKPLIADVFRAQIPLTKFPVKTDGNDFVKFDFAPELLADSNAPFDDAFGQYGLIKYV